MRSRCQKARTLSRDNVERRRLRVYTLNLYHLLVDTPEEIMRRANSRSHSRSISFGSENEMSAHVRPSPAPVSVLQRGSRRKDSLQYNHPNPPLTPNTISASTPQNIPNLQPSAPASPPTPAPSPTPHQRAPVFYNAPPEIEDPTMAEALLLFSRLNVTSKETWLASMVDVCDNQSLSFLHHLISPRLKKDPFGTLPNELCFKVSACLEHGP